MPRISRDIIEHFRSLPWMVQVGLLFAPLAVTVSVYLEIPFLHRTVYEGQALGRDFMNYWTGALLVLNGKIDAVYKQSEYARILSTHWGYGLGFITFSYPPTIFLFIVWLGLFPYPVALALWSIVGILALFAACWPYSKSPLVCVALLLSPAVLGCLDDGQNGLILSALFIGGLRLIPKAPIFAGVLFGITAFKPQLSLLIPVALLASGQRRAFLSTAVTAAILVLLSLAIFGAEGWRLYLTQAVPAQAELYRYGGGLWQAMMPSVLISSVISGLPWGFAMILQSIVTIAMIVATFIWFRRNRQFNTVDQALLIIASFLATPYFHTYDMAAIVAILLIWNINAPALVEQSPPWRVGSTLLWAAPLATFLPGAFWLQRGDHHWPPVGLIAIIFGYSMLVVSAIARCNRSQQSADDTINSGTL